MKMEDDCVDWLHVDQLNSTLSRLNLALTQSREYNGTWYIVQRRGFDLFMMEEPHTSLTFLLNYTTREYIFRIFGVTRERGFVFDTEDFINILRTKFEDCVACLGNARETLLENFKSVEFPFMMIIHKNCPGFFKTKNRLFISEGKGCCNTCSGVQEEENENESIASTGWKEGEIDKADKSNDEQEQKIQEDEQCDEQATEEEYQEDVAQHDEGGEHSDPLGDGINSSSQLICDVKVEAMDPDLNPTHLNSDSIVATDTDTETAPHKQDWGDCDDMKIIPATEKFKEQQKEKKKRGRPKKILPEENLKTKKKLSELTKQKISENNKIFSICKLCSKQCKGFRGLVDHMHRDHPDHQPWQCSICPVKTAFVKTLYRHLKQVHDKLDCACPVCGKTYSRAQSMLSHYNKHNEENDKVHTCLQCDATFKSCEKLTAHQAKKHAPLLNCEDCDKQFSEPGALKEHRRTHTGERPFQCTECGATFSFQSTFLSHRKMHLREKGMTEEEAKLRLYYYCDICGKSYVNSAGLKMHKRHVHDKFSENVPCDVCGTSFRTRDLLKQHQERSHTDCPKYTCDFCGQRFGRRYHLKRHRTVHTAEGFPCNMCSRVFKREDGLSLHQKAHRKTKAQSQEEEEEVEEEHTSRTAGSKDSTGDRPVTIGGDSGGQNPPVLGYTTTTQQGEYNNQLDQIVEEMNRDGSNGGEKDSEQNHLKVPAEAKTGFTLNFLDDSGNRSTMIVPNRTDVLQDTPAVHPSQSVLQSAGLETLQHQPQHNTGEENSRNSQDGQKSISDFVTSFGLASAPVLRSSTVTHEAGEGFEFQTHPIRDENNFLNRPSCLRYRQDEPGEDSTAFENNPAPRDPSGSSNFNEDPTSVNYMNSRANIQHKNQGFQRFGEDDVPAVNPPQFGGQLRPAADDLDIPDLALLGNELINNFLSLPLEDHLRHNNIPILEPHMSTPIQRTFPPVGRIGSDHVNLVIGNQDARQTARKSVIMINTRK